MTDTGSGTAPAREQLESERLRLQSMVDDLTARQPETADLGELSSADQHPADAGTETFNRERDLSLLDNVAGELADVEAALRRLDDGSYGKCQVCGQPIGSERLAALPATPFCRDHAGPQAGPASGGSA